MKNSIGIFAIFLLLMAGKSFAQSTPVADERQQAQQARIREGVVSGDLSRAETARLRAEQRHIRRTERRAKADGKVTARERAKIQQKQNRASRDIRRQKNDGQGRGN
jgi:hypothetical protein